PRDFLDLAALGTICDMVPLLDVNRVIAHKGIDALRATTRPGLIALKNVARVPQTARFGSSHVGFGLGPRINAAGRLADAAEAIELLVTTDSRRAEAIARKIDTLNADRQAIEARMKEECVKILDRAPELLERGAFAIFGEHFHTGVIGIVAQRLTEAHYRPSAIMAPGEVKKGDSTVRIIKGSVRSVPGFHVAQALQSLDHLLLSHGGHAEAGGFSVSYENLAAFQEGFISLAERLISSDGRTRPVVCDLEASFAQVDFKLAEELTTLSPFGVANPSPIFVAKNVGVEGASPLGETHLRLRLQEQTTNHTAVAWNMRGNSLLQKGRRINVAFSPELNTYQGVTSVQLHIKDVWE
ncbi:MAG: hypothetical protein IT290_10635, partial [Deltaproteobacteria bacterium]|nr:hypothetical protein [Deltaproteobacteria bacterium]